MRNGPAVAAASGNRAKKTAREYLQPHMPKEITHWITAERIRDLIEHGSIKEAIDRHPHFYYLGAVVFDSPFYAYGVRNALRFTEIASRLHGVDRGDTFDPFRSFFSSYPAKPPDEALSFISGALTHYSLDVIFHPMVNYFSGKYASSDPARRTRAQTRHRTFEGLMDLYFSGTRARETGGGPVGSLGSDLLNNGRFDRSLQALSDSAGIVDEIVGRLYGIDTRKVPVRPLLKRHGQIQRQLFKRLLSAVLKLAGGITGGPVAVIASTFYPASRSRVLRGVAETFKFFAAPISFIHPNTGEALQGTADDFAARAAVTASDLINGYQAALNRKEGASYLSGKRGLSLEYGCGAGRYPEPAFFKTGTPIRKLCRSVCPPA